MILVTGGTGLVGSHLLYFLLQENNTVRAIKRNNSSLSPLKQVFSSYDAIALLKNIEWVTADILDVPALEKAFTGISQVFHCAALVSFITSDYQQLLKTNIEGTANVVNLCIANNVYKICHVSSVAALGESLNGSAISEETYWNPEADNNGYAISKFGAEMEVWRGSQEGLAVVIVQPAVILGEGHWKSASGSLFTKIKKGIPKYPKGETGFVDVQDIAKAMCLLMKSNVKNESFILSAKNLKFQEIVTKISANLGVKAPKRAFENWELSLLAFFQKCTGFFTGNKASLNKNNIRSLQNVSNYNGSKVTHKIPFKYQNIDTTIIRISERFLKN